ncbi:T9SS type A sorting domain-containing protein [Flavobacterium jejuense]|uniref:T9SS type A sorting domain-containing protein n=1 Tax=Flavobacterium jejuense TaxID=1544455 RepID=A0ABX0IQL0_9FLAO|nr:T9SS type A sorting domain-containing protein [Flavobacterium jejuense]NHN25182.1 T9SS type A sorting domain-containing protein [Flavobacterium jejuense]
MKKLLHVIALFFSLMAFSQYTSIPDTNFEQALIDLGIDTDGTLNGLVLTSDVASIVSIDLDDKNISDLNGIESFSALETLRIRSNNLTQIDLSNNLALKSLYAGYNFFTSVDLSAHTSLMRLGLEGNPLTELLLSSAATQFYEFNVSDTQLTEIDLSGYPDLALVIISNNPVIERFTLKNGNNTGILIYQSSNTPLLSCIEVDDASYSTSNWTSVDANSTFSSDCHLDDTYVPDDNFEQALIDLGYDSVLDDYVTTANISGITSLNVTYRNISDLTGIEDFVSLQVLNCRSNQLTTLDVSNNTELTNLVCGANTITSLDLSANTSLTNLAAELCDLTSITLPLSIQLMNIDGNEFTELDFSGLPNLKYLLVKNNTYLSVLNVQNGNNTNFIGFESTSNPLLYCIVVDDPSYSTTNWTTVSAQVTFRTDCTVPVITLTGANPQEIELGAGYTELGATTSDGSNVVIDASEFVDAVGTYSIYYEATDAAGNEAEQMIRTVNVVDTTPPTIICAGETWFNLDEYGTYTVLIEQIDNGSNDLSGIQSITIDQDSFDCTYIGTPVTITLTVTDNNNLSETCTTTAHFVDNTLPVFDTNTLPDDMTVAYNNAENNGYILPDFTTSVVVTDNCTSSVVADQYPSPGQTLTSGLHTITLEIFDDSNNFDFYEFVINVDGTLSAATYIIDGLTVYPIPTHDRVNLDVVVDAVRVTNLTGQEVMQLTQTASIDLSEMPNGIYFAQINKDGKQEVVRLIKK